MDPLHKKFDMRRIMKDVVDRSLANVQNIMREDVNEENLDLLLSYQETVKRKLHAVKTLEEEILQLTDNTGHMEEILSEGTDYEIYCKAKLNTLHNFLTKNTVSQGLQPKYKSQDNVRLPKLEIKRFNGDGKLWQGFIDSFQAAVDRSTTLSNVEKFNYLQGYLEGDALKCISGLSLTEGNYTEALKVLKNRYGNPKTIISAHMSSLVKIAPVISDDIISLRRLYDEIESHVRSLFTLGIDIKTHGCMLSTVILEKLPLDIKLIISRNINESDEWDFKEILRLLDRELKARETCMATQRNATKEQEENGNYNFDSSANKYTGASLYTNSDNFKSSERKGKRCVFCNGSHWSDKCNIISDPKCRKEFLKNNKLCFNCLRKDHLSQKCDKAKTCFYCKGLHNSAICFTRAKNYNKDKKDEKRDSESAQNFVSNHSSILLPTAVLTLQNPKNKREVKIKVMFDQGGQRTYITKRTKDLLKLDVLEKEHMGINTFGDENTKSKILERVSLQLKNDKNRTFEIQALCIELICLPIKNQLINYAQNNFEHLKGLKFADAGSEENIDLLIGSDYYWSLITGRTIKSKKIGEPVALETHFGWLLNGPVQGNVKNVSGVYLSSCSTSHCLLEIDSKNDESQTESSLNKFWDLETLGVSENEKSKYDEFFSDSIYVNEENRYETKLPFKENHAFLHDHFDICESRLRSLHSKLKQNPDLMKRYDEVFKEQLESKIIERADNPVASGNCHYIPHNPVIREDHDTTKLRIVFDASAKSTGPSLNDCLYKGPQLTPLLFDILIRFRTFLIAITADIEKAFLQISINDADSDFLRFLWFDDVFAEEPKIVRNRFARVIFGVTSSPFLLNGVIRKHNEIFDFDPEFQQKVLDSFYVDDFSGGESNVEKAYDLFKKLKLRFLEGLFNLRKWRTNDQSLRKLIYSEVDENNSTSPSKILGILWDEINDNFIFDFKEICELGQNLKATKRNVLKILSMFYDPTGLIQPIIVNQKIIFQEICKLKLSWDEEIPNDLKLRWLDSLKSLNEIEKIEIPRKALDSSNSKTIELHGFSDASLKGYGACIYLRTISNDNKISVNLITAKSRVAPMKEMSIPRLELMGSLVLARLMEAVKNALKNTIKVSNFYYWTDSKVSLSWIKAQNKKFKTFVENRVQEIRKLTNISNWFYCNTLNNPADLLTRTEVFSNLQREHLWWEGPKFLMNELNFENENAFEHEGLDEQLLPEIKMCVSISKPTDNNLFDINRFSSLKKLYRTTAWVKRFISNLKNKAIKKAPLELSPFLTSIELKESEHLWIKINQSFFEKQKLELLSKQLNLISDENNLLRCQGRLQNSPLPYDSKTPFLINSQHRLAELIVFDIHKRLKHISVKHTLTELRQRFWICRGRSFVRNILSKCTICRRFEGPSYKYPTTPPLTKLRLNDTHAFYTTGIDNFGPLYVKNIFNGNDLHKVWVTLYTCAASRGVIFDLVPNMTSTSFVSSFQRFVSRRGCPTYVISDGGKNFVSVETQEFVNGLGVDWKVNLPLSPWHGGFFERLVRNTKQILRKTLQNSKLNYADLQTLLFEVENILNNRPITYYYEDELESCLTPNHLLFGRILNQTNHNMTDFSYTPTYIQSSKLQNLLTHFWERWRREYLTTLREHHLYNKDIRNRPIIKINDVVLIEEDKQPRASWQIARVEQLIEGSDGNVRGATLKNPKSGQILKRPVNKLYKIESFDFNVNKVIEKDNVDNVETVHNFENKDKENVHNTSRRPQREAAIIGELRRKIR